MAGEDGNVSFESRVIIEEEEIGGLDYSGVVASDDSDDSDDYKWCVVGRFLTDKAVNCIALKNVLPPIWKLVRGVFIIETALNLFLFQFCHEMDMRRVLDDGPWTFEYNLLICRQLVVGETVAEIEMLSCCAKTSVKKIRKKEAKKYLFIFKSASNITMFFLK